MTVSEVMQINYITKKRAYRYIAAAEKEWLYPETHLKNSHWRKLGNGYLLMPEPRGIYMGGEVVIGYEGGRSDSFSEYGHKPWQRGYKDEKRHQKETRTLERFKAEFAKMHGPEWRGSSDDFGGKARHEKDSPEMYEHYLKTAQKYGKRRRPR